ncbi:tape measure protein [Pseudomonas asiatica]|uniref:tape measure protein n=1 Tax=Pseudomonas asiatica TaxID=2219225 RepID=UPI0025AA3781|nr:tape measure protein [Pseudomonas asiatica]MDM9589986.1 tape measure protein [Pseudomonas asiatica]
MNEQAIAELFAKIGFKVDPTGIKQATALLKSLEKQTQATGKAMQNALKGTGGKGIAQAQQAMNKAQFDAAMQNAKFTKVQQQGAATQLKTQQQRVKLQQEQQKLAALQATAQRKAAISNLQAQGVGLANQLKSLNLTNRAAAAQRKAQLDAVRHSMAQHRLNRLQAGSAGTHITGRHGPGLLGHGVGAIHRFGGVGSFAGRVAAGGAVEGLGGLAGGLSGAATGLGAVAGSAALVVAAFAAVTAAATAFAREAERAANTRNQRIGQFEAVGPKTLANAERMNARFENFAQTEGFSTKELGADYAKIVGALSAKVGVNQSADVAEGILRYGKAQHLSNENISKVSLGIRQALGKGQLYSEEWTGQISEHLGAHANAIGAEAWQRATGGKLTGDAALEAFTKDRGDKKIRGEQLTKFFVELGAVMDRRANEGGLLDKARNTQESWDNRISNQYQANLSSAFTKSGLDKTMPSLYESLVKALNELQPQFDALGDASNYVLQGFTGLVKNFTKMIAWFNDGNSLFDPKFTKELSAAFDELGVSAKALLHSIFGNDGLGFAFDALKVVGETAIGVITTIVDVFSTLVDVFTAVFRVIQDGLHFLPDNLGGISDEKYAAILKQREADDKQRADIQAKRKAALDGVSPQADQAKNNTDPNASWRVTDNSDVPPVDNKWRVTDGSDIPTVPNKLAVMATPPVTPPVQPAVNGQSVSNSVVYNINVTTGDTNISGVETDKMHGVIGDVKAELVKAIQDSHKASSPLGLLATQTRARGN